MGTEMKLGVQKSNLKSFKAMRREEMWGGTSGKERLVTDS